MHIQFLGATHTVTGSKFLIQTASINLLVDCGLYQGHHAYEQNIRPLPISPKEIDYILLSHAHIDHSGYIPLLVKQGFCGQILATEATKSLCAILLPDSGHIHEEEANKQSRLKDKQVSPLYTYEDALNSLAYFKVITMGKKYSLDENLTFYFQRAGHILGAASIYIQHYDVSLLYSGDLGRVEDPLLYPPAKPQQADYLIVESTYGDTEHGQESPKETLRGIINATTDKQGKVLIPSFAVGRTQNILFFLHQLKVAKEIPDIPIYIDSPMAIRATKLLFEYERQHKLDNKQMIALCQEAQYIRSFDDSLSLDDIPGSAIIISASGMLQGGRVLYHLKDLARSANNAIVFTGYQAEFTTGEKIVHGAKIIKVFGETVPIRGKIFQLPNVSAHADSKEMLSWLSHIKKTPRKVFITHGEEEKAQHLKAKLISEFGWTVEVPELFQKEELV